MLTTYFSLWEGIPSILKDQFKNVPKDIIMREPPIVNYMKKCKKGTSVIRHVWDSNNVAAIPIGQNKWSEEFNLTNEEDWEFIYSLAKQCRLDANTIFFHFQITHHTIMTNKKCNDLCEECQTREDITHLLYNCPAAFDIWEDLQNWLTICTNKVYHFDQKSILLGNKLNGLLINTLILLTKHKLYKKKWKENILNLNYLKRIFLRQMQVEIYNGTVCNKLAKVLGKWSPLHNTLNNL